MGSYRSHNEAMRIAKGTARPMRKGESSFANSNSRGAVVTASNRGGTGGMSVVDAQGIETERELKKFHPKQKQPTMGIVDGMEYSAVIRTRKDEFGNRIRVHVTRKTKRGELKTHKVKHKLYEVVNTMHHFTHEEKFPSEREARAFARDYYDHPHRVPDFITVRPARG